MKLTLLKNKRIIVGLAATLLLGSTMRPVSLVHAANPATGGTTANAVLVPTNDPNIFSIAGPPASFDPTTAGTSDLERYGLPLPPDASKDPAGYQNWLALMRNAAHRVVPTFLTHPSVYHTLSSSNWSGTVDLSGAGPTSPGGGAPFTVVEGQWVVPSVAQSQRTGYSSTWVGLDGWGNKQVEQLGTEQDASVGLFCGAGGTPCSPQTNYYFWIETYPASEQGVGGFPVSPGDTIYASVTYYFSNNTLHFFAEDQTKRATLSLIVPARYGCPGASAEWIEERTTFNNLLWPLPNYGSVSMIDSHYGTTIFPIYPANFGIQSAWSTVFMYNGGDLLSWVLPTAPDTEEMHWNSYS
jgi:hypothetical protein